MHRFDPDETFDWKLTVDGEDMITLGWKSKEVAEQIAEWKVEGSWKR